MSDTSKKRIRIEVQMEQLTNWCARYPRIHIDRYEESLNILREYSTSEQDYNKLKEEYILMRKYYDYIKERICRGKLSSDVSKICKEANVKGVFGYPTFIEELSRKYRISPDKINYIIARYQTMELFVSAYKNGEINSEDDVLRATLRKFWDLDFSGNPNLDRLLEDIFDSADKTVVGPIIYSSSQLLNIIENLTPRKRTVIIMKYGLYANSYMKNVDIARQIGISAEAVRVGKNRTLCQLGSKSKMRQWVFDSGNPDLLRNKNESLISEENKALEEIKDIIYNSSYIFNSNIEFTGDMDLDMTRLEELKSILIPQTGSRIEKEQSESNDLLKGIDTIGLSTRAVNALTKNGIKTVEQLLNYDVENIIHLRGIGVTVYREIQSKIDELYILFPQAQILYGQSRSGKETLERILKKVCEKLRIICKSNKCFIWKWYK